MAWSVLFALIFFALLAMPYFAPLSWPSRALVFVRFVLVLAAILWLVEVGITGIHDGAAWRARVALGDGSAALALSLIGPCLIILGPLAPVLERRPSATG